MVNHTSTHTMNEWLQNKVLLMNFTISTSINCKFLTLINKKKSIFEISKIDRKKIYLIPEIKIDHGGGVSHDQSINVEMAI